jgi:hypothetical protein
MIAIWGGRVAVSTILRSWICTAFSLLLATLTQPLVCSLRRLHYLNGLDAFFLYSNTVATLTIHVLTAQKTYVYDSRHPRNEMGIIIYNYNANVHESQDL